MDDTSILSPPKAPSVLAGLSDVPSSEAANVAERTGETGKTGETVFVGQSAQWALNQSAVGPAFEDDAEEVDLDDVVVPPNSRSVALRAIPVVLLFAVILFSYLKLRELDAGPGEGDLGAGPVEDREGSAGALQHFPPGAQRAKQGGIVPDELPRGVQVPQLLDRTVERVRPDEAPAFLKLGDVVSPRKITLVNFWATWCAPCKREFPELKAMFEKAEWGSRVRFASIQSQDGEDPSIAYRNFAREMPSSEFFLAGLGATDTAATEVLRTAGLIDEPKLPISVVFDCQQEVRLALVGGLTGEDLVKLRTQLDSLVAELDTPFCRKRPQQRAAGVEAAEPARESTVAASGENSAPRETNAVCGDGRCERPDESCSTCRSDCGCPGGETCRNGRCAKSVSGLK